MRHNLDSHCLAYSKLSAVVIGQLNLERPFDLLEYPPVHDIRLIPRVSCPAAPGLFVLLWTSRRD